MKADLIRRVETACARLVARGERVTFTAVVTDTGIARSTLYRHPELRTIVEEHRRADREAQSFNGIVVELGLLRQGLEAVAAKVRRQEEELRALRRQIATRR